uniref:Uncharacterized protein n=1 Tax=Ciona intestinalis TaxID=7719 RepID=H2XSA3_CIOIN
MGLSQFLIAFIPTMAIGLGSYYYLTSNQYQHKLERRVMKGSRLTQSEIDERQKEVEELMSVLKRASKS